MLTDIEKQARQAQAAADQVAAAPQPLLRLGQRVLHKELGYRGLVAGWDVGCSEGSSWQEAVTTELELTRGDNQPFYHVRH
jgi:hemimethylated DNA binding protein